MKTQQDQAVKAALRAPKGFGLDSLFLLYKPLIKESSKHRPAGVWRRCYFSFFKEGKIGGIFKIENPDDFFGLFPQKK